MTDKEFRRMSRADLVRIIFQYQQKEMELQAKLDEATLKLEDRRIRIENSGSLAEAALSVNHVMEAAQSAADQYIYEMKAKAEEGNVDFSTISSEDTEKARRQAEELLRDAKTKSTAVLSKTSEICKKYKEQTEQQCAEIVQRTEAECAAMKEKAQMDCDALRAKTTQEMRKAYERIIAMRKEKN